MLKVFEEFQLKSLKQNLEEQVEKTQYNDAKFCSKSSVKKVVNKKNLTKKKYYKDVDPESTCTSIYDEVLQGERFPCGRCDYKATTQSNLKRHQRYKHEGLIYECE